MSEASFNQQQQNVDSQYNAGRDQIIQNIVLVGRFLDYTKIQGLIPKQTPVSDFTSIINAFESAFPERLEDDLTDGISFVGETLKETISKVIPKSQNALPTQSNSAILASIFRAILIKIYSMNYHIHFSESIELAEEPSSYKSARNILWFDSLQLLWAKHFQQDEKQCKFGILLRTWEGGSTSMIRITKSYRFEYVDFDKLSVEQIRVMMIGFVIDLLRLYTMGASHLKFWQGLVDLITKDYKKAQSESNDSEKSA